MSDITYASQSKSHNFNIRDARLTAADDHFIVQAFDSTLPYLASIGSGEQWGPIPFSERAGFKQETLESIEQAEKYRATKSGDAIRILIAEIEIEPSTTQTSVNLSYRIDGDGRRFLSVGTTTIRENWLPSYLTSKADLLGLETLQAQGFKDILYLEVMITDYRTGSSRKGAGEALIKSIIEYGRKVGKKFLYVDGWAGNNRKLIQYYEHQGFSIVSDFSLMRRNGSTWLGTLLRMDLQPSETLVVDLN